MGSSEKGRRVGGSVAILMVGLLMGSVMLTPVGAHIKNFNHLKTKHFYTKKAANAEFVNVGEAAPNATNAANADKLDNLDSTVFQQKCLFGSVLAWAHVKGTTTFPGTFTSSVGNTTQFGTTFNCASATNEVRARRLNIGEYELSFPGLSDRADNGGDWIAVGAHNDDCWFGDICQGYVVSINSSTVTGEGDTLKVLLSDTEHDTSGEGEGISADLANDIDDNFLVIVYGYQKI